MVRLGVGLIEVELPRPMPFDGLTLGASGETASPMSILGFNSTRPGDPHQQILQWDFCKAGDRIGATLEFAPHQ